MIMRCANRNLAYESADNSKLSFSNQNEKSKIISNLSWVFDAHADSWWVFHRFEEQGFCSWMYSSVPHWFVRSRGYCRSCIAYPFSRGRPKSNNPRSWLRVCNVEARKLYSKDAKPLKSSDHDFTIDATTWTKLNKQYWKYYLYKNMKPKSAKFLFFELF